MSAARTAQPFIGEAAPEQGGLVCYLGDRRLMLIPAAVIVFSFLCSAGSPAALVPAETGPVLRCVDALDGDRALSLQNRMVRVVLLQVLNADSLASVRFGGRFDPDRIQILDVIPGSAWDGTDFASQVFHRSVDALGGIYEVVSGVLGSSRGLSGSGPHTIALMRLRAMDEALTPSSRWAHQRLTLDTDRCGLSDLRGPIGKEWETQDLLLRFGYLGDLATGWMGADSVPPHMIPRPDGRIHFEDQLVFTLGWNGADGVQDPIADIGPVSGTAPDLISIPDRKWDIDDILAFTTMYSWDVESGREPWLPVLRDERGKSPLPRTGPRIGSRIISSPCAREGELVVELIDGMDLTGVHVILGWNPDAGIVGEVVSTGLLAGADGEMFLTHRGEGCQEAGITRLDPISPGSCASGVLIRVPFTSAGAGSLEWRLFWDLYDSRGRPISWGRWSDAAPQSSIRLSTPIPNPSSGEAKLGFRLDPGLSARLSVFDVHGRLLRRYRVMGEDGSEQQLWFDGLDQRGRKLAPGIYVFRLESEGQTMNQGMVIGR